MSEQKKKPHVALVVPSIRRDSFERFVSEWSRILDEDGRSIFDRCTLILMEDNPTKTFEIPSTLDRTSPVHFCWEDIDTYLGKDAWVIPRRSDTVRSFAYWWAWREGFDFIMTLDDDCYPMPGYEAPDLVHLEALTCRSRWFNTLTNVKPRGVPFKNIGTNGRNVLNHGLWTHVLDYDAPTQLVAPVEEEFPHDSRTVPANTYYPMCGMNLMWRADVTYAMYHLLMGCVDSNSLLSKHAEVGRWLDEQPLVKLDFDRFGDIWAGLLSKKLFDEYALNVTTGVPYIHHDRASDPFVNLRKEANGLQVNESFWEFVDEGWRESSVEWDDALAAYHAICDGAFEQARRRWPEHASYFAMMREACAVWCALFRNSTRGTKFFTGHSDYSWP